MVCFVLGSKERCRVPVANVLVSCCLKDVLFLYGSVATSQFSMSVFTVIGLTASLPWLSIIVQFDLEYLYVYLIL